MSRTFVMIIAFGLAGCKAQPKGVQIEARELIPKDANVAFGFEFEAVLQSPVGATLYRAMQSDKDLRTLAAAVKTCNIDLTNTRGLLATTTAGERMFGMLEGPHIGSQDNVACVERAGRGISDGAVFRFETRGDVRVLEQEGGGYAVLLNENALAIVDATWDDEVFRAIEDPAARNTTGALSAAIHRIAPSTDAWLVAVPTDKDLADSPEFGVVGMNGLVVDATADLASGGAKLRFGIELPAAADPKPLEQTIHSLLDGFRSELSDGDLPKNLLDSVAVSRTKARITVALQLGNEVLQKVLRVVEREMAK